MQNPPETVNIAAPSIAYDNFRTDFDLSAGDYAAIVTGYDHYPDNVGEWMYSIYGQAYIIEYDAAVSIGGDNTNTGEFVMPTTSDLTLRVDGEQVDNLEISRGESIDFSFGIDGGGAFPSNFVGGFGIPGESGGSSYLRR